MARTTGTTTRSRRKADPVETEATTSTSTEAEAPAEAVPAEEAPMSETETVEATASDTTEAVVETTETDADKAAEKAAEESANQEKLTEFEATVSTALAEKDVTTGTLPAAQIEAVKTAYRGLPGAKLKNSAKRYLGEQLREAVNTADLMSGVAVMALTDAIENAGPAPRTPVERKPVDPNEIFQARLATAHLAYILVRENPGENVDADASAAVVEEKVGSLTEAAQSYYNWVTSTAEDKGDEPADVDPIVKAAVKSALGKASGTKRSGGSTPREPRAASDGPRRNVRTHIAQAFVVLGRDKGDIAKVAEIANAKTEEYPDGDCSPGAISAALKSVKGVDGFELVADSSGHAAAKKL